MARNKVTSLFVLLSLGRVFLGANADLCAYNIVQDRYPDKDKYLAGSMILRVSAKPPSCRKLCEETGKKGDFYGVPDSDKYSREIVECEGYVTAVPKGQRSDPDHLDCLLILRPVSIDDKGIAAIKEYLLQKSKAPWNAKPGSKAQTQWYDMMAKQIRRHDMIGLPYKYPEILDETAKMLYFHTLPWGVRPKDFLPQDANQRLKDLEELQKRELAHDMANRNKYKDGYTFYGKIHCGCEAKYIHIERSPAWGKVVKAEEKERVARAAYQEEETRIKEGKANLLALAKEIQALKKEIAENGAEDGTKTYTGQVLNWAWKKAGAAAGYDMKSAKEKLDAAEKKKGRTKAKGRNRMERCYGTAEGGGRQDA